MYAVIVRHCSLKAGEIGADMREAYRERFYTPKAAAYALLAQIEGGANVPAGRHGHLLVLDEHNGLEYPLDAFAKSRGIKLPKTT